MTRLATAARAVPFAADQSKLTSELDPRQVREAAKLSQTDMADLMGMSLNGYSLWEKGARRPGGPARRLLQLIDDDPKGVIAALQ